MTAPVVPPRDVTVPRQEATVDIQEVELLAIGAGPANLALAVALEEMAPEDLATRTVVIEQHGNVTWQRGMLLPWTLCQVSFLKDLVTRRNPCSRFSFVNYLHSTGRLDAFINLGSVLPYRSEISDYLRWVAHGLQKVRIAYGRRCVAIEPVVSDGGEVTRWSVRLADGGEIRCRGLVLGAGRDPYVPEVFAAIPRERLIHSTEYLFRIDEFDPAAPHRVVVVGGAQSAAEMLWATHQRFPRAACTMVMRSIGLNCYESSKFTNELFYPSFVDEFHAAQPEARAQLLREMHRTNYSGLAPDLLDALYRQMYLERLAGTPRLKMIAMSEIVDAEVLDGEVALTIVDRKSGRPAVLRCDVVMLGTGFVRDMPTIVRDLAATAGLDDVSVTRSYRLELPPRFAATCHLQGVNEATHGIADSLLSVLASRSEEIVADLLSVRQTTRLLAGLPARR
jgi:L-ornithine N5-monooxygenase